MSKQHPVSPPPITAAWLPLVSFLLFVHLFVVVVGMVGNYAPSPLVARLLVLLRPYSQPLNFDLNFTPYYLTHGTAADVDHSIEYQREGDSPDTWHALGEGAVRWGESIHRYQHWARMAAMFAEDEVDQVPAELARAAAQFLISRGERPSRLRVRRHLLQPWEVVSGQDRESARDPFAEDYYRTLYEANVLIDAQGRAAIAKVSGRMESAQPLQQPGDAE